MPSETAALAEARTLVKTQKKAILKLLERDFFFSAGGFPEWCKTTMGSQLYVGTSKWVKKQGKKWYFLYLF